MKHFLITIFIAHFILAAFAQNNVIIKAADASLTVGQQIKYPITINPNGNSVGAFQFIIEYDKDLFQILDLEGHNDWTVVSNPYTPGIIKVAGVLVGARGQNTTFTAVNLTVKAIGQAGRQIKLKQGLVGDNVGKALSHQLSNGSISINGIIIPEDIIPIEITYLPCGSDANSLLLLQFDGTLEGDDGETPLASSSIAYTNGKYNNALNSTSTLKYTGNNNIDPQKGTVEAWVKPTWNGNDGKGHILMQYGEGGGLVIMKDGANNLRLILNLFSPSGYPEIDVSKNISDWQANQWKHIAFTWGNGKLELYIDGIPVIPKRYTVPLYPVNYAHFNIGMGNGGLNWEGEIDHLRISNTVRSESEITNFMNNCIRTKLAQNTTIEINNFPNPFTGETKIEYTLPNETPVTLFVTDMMGKKVATLLNNEQQSKGYNSVTFDGSNFPSGMYYYTLQAGDYVSTQKMTLMK